MISQHENLGQTKDAYQSDNLEAADRDASNQSPAHINTTTVVGRDEEGNKAVRHWEGQVYKYSTTKRYFTVKDVDGEMTTRNKMSIQRVRERVRTQRQLDIDAEAEELKGHK